MVDRLPLLSLAALASGWVRATSVKRRSRPREPDSVYGRIRAVLERSPFRAVRAREVRAALARQGVTLSHESVCQKLHKMRLRRQVQQVVVPGEWFSRWQVWM